MQNHNKAFGTVLRDMRKEQGLTQEELAFQCGLDRTYVSLLELGSNSPTLNTMVLLCSALDVSLVGLANRIEDQLKESVHGAGNKDIRS